MPPQFQQFQNPTSPVIKPNESPQPNKKKRGLKFIVLGLVLLVVAIGLSLWSAKIKSQESVTNTKNIGTDTSEEFSEWKTYRNEEYGFEIKYPKELEFKYVSEDKSKDYDNYAFFYIYVGDSRIFISPRGGYDYGPPLEDPEIIHTEISGKNMTIYKWKLKDGKILAWYFLLDKVSNWNQCNSKMQNCARLELKANNENDFSKLNQILSTFKFISTSTDTIKLLQICPDEWIQNNMPGVQGEQANRQYYILNGQRREVEEFDTTWVLNNCNLEKQVVY